MWTTENRGRYDRSRLRYPSDLTDEEWALIAPLIAPAKPGGNKRTVNLREVMNGIMYVLSTGCQWRAIPKDLPRYARLVAARHRSPCRHSGSRWRHSAAGNAVRQTSLFDDAVRRRRLSGTPIPTSAGRHLAVDRPRDRQASTARQRICSPAQALDCRAHHRMAQPLQKARKGLGEPQSHRPRILAPRLNPPHAAKALQANLMFPDRL